MSHDYLTPPSTPASALTAIAPRHPNMVGASVHVQARPETIFAMLVDPRRHHEIDGSGTVGTEVIGPRELQLGDRFIVAMKMYAIPYRITSQVTALVPNELIEWRPSAGHRWRWELSAEGEGTRVTEIFDWSDSKVPPLLRVIRASERNAASIAATLTTLQANCAP